MKKILICTLLMGFGSILAAHPASKINFKYFPKLDRFEVKISHNSAKPAQHYTQTIAIKVNGEERVLQKLRRQTDKKGVMAIYRMFLLKGDKVEVFTRCSKGGDKVETYLFK